MRAFASSFHAWRSLERQEGIKVPHGLVFPLAVVEAIGRPHGLTLTAEEHEPAGPRGYDAIMISVLDSRCMVNAAKHFRAWRVPFRRIDRGDDWPVVIAGGQGLHNPLPMAPVADVICIGDGEDPIPAMLRAWHSTPSRRAFLAACAEIEGLYVPSIHDRTRDTIKQSIASDVTITVREAISVSHDGSRRIEITRGCRYKCTFCSLGWRTPARENAPDVIVEAIRRSPKRVHLAAGDAESHSGIDVIRAALREHGGSDLGWTGRLDTLFENPDQTIPGQKRYAFGVEGVSWRLRRAVGKGYLTDERLVTDTCRFFDNIEGEDTRGRAAWHVIAGLPTEREREVMDLMRVVQEIDRRRAGKTRRNLAIHWQPFQPLPGTPMQWCAGGSGAGRMLSYLRPLERLAWVGLRQQGGRTDAMALVCTVLARADERGADLLEALAERTVSVEEAERITGTTCGELDPDAPLPWDFVQQHYDRPTLRRAYNVMMARLCGEDGVTAPPPRTPRT